MNHFIIVIMFLQCLIVIVIVLLIVNRWRSKKFLKLHQQLGTDWPYYPIIGNALTFLGNNEDRMKVLMEASLNCNQRKYKAISFWIGNLTFVLINDVEQASVILKSALNKNYLHKFAKEFIGYGSAFAPVKMWFPRRKVLEPTFATRHINKFARVFERQSKVTAELLEDKVGKGDFSIFDYVKPYTFETTCDSLFGFSSEGKKQRDHPAFKVLKNLFEIVIERFCKPWLHIDAIYKILPIHAKNIRLSKQLHYYMDDLINNKISFHEEIKNNTDKSDNLENESKHSFKTFLDLLNDYSNNTYTHEELREESIVILGASSDTTSIALGFLVVLLAKHADVQDKIVEEIHEVLGDLNGPCQAEDLLKMKYSRAVIKESLRLYPPVPIIIRYCDEDRELPNGVVLPTGTNVLISIWGMNRNREHWGEDADEFKPHRFLSEGVHAHNTSTAFTNGPRSCVGQKFAMLSMTSFLVTTLRRYRFLLPKSFENDKSKSLFKLSMAFTLQDANNYMIQIERRERFKD